MDFVLKNKNPNPVTNANIVSRHFFLWLLPLFVKGYKKDLEVSDLYVPQDIDLSSDLGDKLEREWERQLKSSKLSDNGKKPKLAKALWALFGNDYLTVVSLYFVSECILRVVQTLLIREIVRSFGKESGMSLKGQSMLAGGMIVTSFLICIIIHPGLHNALITGMRCRISCSSLIYRKMLRLSRLAQGKTTVGQLVNILSNDVNRFDQTLLFLPYILLGPIQVAILSFFVWRESGLPALTGVGVILILTFFQYWNATQSTKLRQKIATKTDTRCHTMNQIIMAIRVIKMYAWEQPFTKLINKLRRREMITIRKRWCLRGIFSWLFSSSSKALPFITFLGCFCFGEKLSAGEAFFIVAVYNVLVQNMLNFVPAGVAGVGEVLVALERMERFLLLEEKGEMHKKNFARVTDISQTEQDQKVCMHSVTASWGDGEANLHNITFQAVQDNLVVIVGPVGAGKSTFLQAMLGELPLEQGTCSIHGQVSYASQEPWILPATLRHNIIFGREFDPLRYKEVIKISALVDDLKQLPYGDLTLVGERGVSLSGGQKARVNLARALYQPADIYLLDDPLSAVDSSVSRHLFDQALKTFLKGKLRILVTHHLQYLPEADHVIVLDKGRIIGQGTLKELISQNVGFLQLPTDDNKNMVSMLITDTIESGVIGNANRDESSRLSEEDPKLDRMQQIHNQHSEKMVKGSLSLRVYWNYCQMVNSPVAFISLVVACLLAQVAITTTELFMGSWIHAEEQKNQIKAENSLGDMTNTSFEIYGAFVVIFVVLNFLRAVAWFVYSYPLCVNMHNHMFSSVVKSPTRFFDNNPSGRVLNRFTNDLGSIDEILPPVFFETTIVTLQSFGALVIVIVSNPILSVPVAIILLILWVMRNFYIRSARDIKRMDGMTKSGVLTHAAASFQGLTSIRAAQAETTLIEQFDANTDIHTSSWFMFLSTARFFEVWVELVSILFLAIVTFSFILIDNPTSYGNVGLAITSSIHLTMLLQFAIRRSAVVGTLMSSVERALEYVNLSPEADVDSKPEYKPPNDWPQKGEILFKNVSLAYTTEDVLHQLNFRVKPKEKIGIVGRTGAGKSSIIQALFRMTEPQGHIYIDSVKINDIGLHDLRRNISIIPQDPVLFCGSMRYNLDPFDQFQDSELWTVLEEVGLKEKIPQLSFEILDGGENFSMGQKQLLCLARAILRKNKIIVMDETTANIDPRTDSFIQETIRRKFSNCTIITIAHRLNTVMDSDRIMVLDKGVLVEFDHPWVLLQNENSALSTLVNSTGIANSSGLKQLAEVSFSALMEGLE